MSVPYCTRGSYCIVEQRGAVVECATLQRHSARHVRVHLVDFVGVLLGYPLVACWQVSLGEVHPAPCHHHNAHVAVARLAW